MSTFDPIIEADMAFRSSIESFRQCPAMVLLRSGITLDHYKSALKEIFHYTKENPQMQSMATVFFRGNDRQGVKMFLRHAISEVGHDQLALNDLEALGEDTSDVPEMQPLPSTVAFTAYGFYQMQMRNPVGYLGYLYFLEYLPTQHGTLFADALKMAGVPREAMSFLADHMHADMGHNRLMDGYLTRHVHDRKDMDAVIYGMNVCAHLYGQMLGGAFDRVISPRNFGESWEEKSRRNSARMMSEPEEVPH